MTAINLAVDPSIVAIYSDTLTVGDAATGRASKCIAIPHLRLAVAAAGYREFSWNLQRALEAGILGDRLADAILEAPGWLRAVTASRRPCTAFLVGVAGRDRVDAFELSSATEFAARRLEPGLWLLPGLRPHPGESQTAPPRVATTGATTPERSEPLLTLPEPPRPWPERLHRAARVMAQQARESSGAIGGEILQTIVTPDSISQKWLRPLAINP